MSLSNPEPRRPIHQRTIQCAGYLRSDRLWDIEATLTDTKGYAIHSDFRRVEAGQPFHQMSIRLSVDDELIIRDVEAVIDAAPHKVCPSITPNFQRLLGLRIGGGFLREARKHLGGVNGCAHLVELLGPIATAAMQTIFPIRGRPKGEEIMAPPMQIGGCHALAATSEVVAKYWPFFHQKSATAL